MPRSIERLAPTSEDAQITAAISECIAYCIKNEGLTQQQAAGKCYGMAREKTKKQLGQGG
jgi:hypothetical protein